MIICSPRNTRNLGLLATVLNFAFVFAFYQLISFKDAKQSPNDTHPVPEEKISRGSSISVILSRLTLSDLPSGTEGEVQEHGNKELWHIKQLSGCNAAGFVTYLHLQFALLLRQPCPTAARHAVLWTQVCKI